VSGHEVSGVDNLTVVDDDLWQWEVGSFFVGGEGLGGGTVTLNWMIDPDDQMTVAQARELGAALLAAADHAEAVAW